MKPEIVETGPMTLLGMSFFGDPFGMSSDWSEENEIGRLWKRFMAFLTERGPLAHVVGNVAYEVHIVHAETGHTGHHEVFVGLQVERLEEAPVELVAKVLPAKRYALFTLHGLEITSDWDRSIGQALQAAGYSMSHKYSVQRYDARFHGLDHLEASVLDVLVPVD